MPERNQGPRQLRLINAGDLENGGENGDEDIANLSWESVMKDVGRMSRKLGFPPDAGLADSDEEKDELVA